MNEPTVPLMPMPGHLPNPGIQQVMGPNDAANAAAPAHDAAGTAMLGNLNSSESRTKVLLNKNNHQRLLKLLYGDILSCHAGGNSGAALKQVAKKILMAVVTDLKQDIHAHFTNDVPLTMDPCLHDTLGANGNVLPAAQQPLNVRRLAMNGNVPATQFEQANGILFQVMMQRMPEDLLERLAGHTTAIENANGIALYILMVLDFTPKTSSARKAQLRPLHEFAIVKGENFETTIKRMHDIYLDVNKYGSHNVPEADFIEMFMAQMPPTEIRLFDVIAGMKAKMRLAPNMTWIQFKEAFRTQLYESLPGTGPDTIVIPLKLSRRVATSAYAANLFQGEGKTCETQSSDPILTEEFCCREFTDDEYEKVKHLRRQIQNVRKQYGFVSTTAASKNALGRNEARSRNNGNRSRNRDFGHGNGHRYGNNRRRNDNDHRRNERDHGRQRSREDGQRRTSHSGYSRSRHNFNDGSTRRNGADRAEQSRRQTTNRRNTRDTAYAHIARFRPRLEPGDDAFRHPSMLEDAPVDDRLGDIADWSHAFMFSTTSAFTDDPRRRWADADDFTDTEDDDSEEDSNGDDDLLDFAYNAAPTTEATNTGTRLAGAAKPSFDLSRSDNSQTYDSGSSDGEAIYSDSSDGEAIYFDGSNVELEIFKMCQGYDYVGDANAVYEAFVAEYIDDFLQGDHGVDLDTSCPFACGWDFVMTDVNGQFDPFDEPARLIKDSIGTLTSALMHGSCHTDIECASLAVKFINDDIVDGAYCPQVYWTDVNGTWTRTSFFGDNATCIPLSSNGATFLAPANAPDPAGVPTATELAELASSMEDIAAEVEDLEDKVRQRFDSTTTTYDSDDDACESNGSACDSDNTAMDHLVFDTDELAWLTTFLAVHPERSLDLEAKKIFRHHFHGLQLVLNQVKELELDIPVSFQLELFRYHERIRDLNYHELAPPAATLPFILPPLTAETETLTVAVAPTSQHVTVLTDDDAYESNNTTGTVTGVQNERVERVGLVVPVPVGTVAPVLDATYIRRSTDAHSHRSTVDYFLEGTIHIDAMDNMQFMEQVQADIARHPRRDELAAHAMSGGRVHPGLMHMYNALQWEILLRHVDEWVWRHTEPGATPPDDYNDTNGHSPDGNDGSAARGDDTYTGTTTSNATSDTSHDVATVSPSTEEPALTDALAATETTGTTGTMDEGPLTATIQVQRNVQHLNQQQMRPNVPSEPYYIPMYIGLHDTPAVASPLLFDTGAGRCCENDIQRLSRITTLRKPMRIIGVGGTATVSHTGSWMPGFDDVCYMPHLKVALFSPNEFMRKFGGHFKISTAVVEYTNARIKYRSIFARAASDGQLIVDMEEMAKIIEICVAMGSINNATKASLERHNSIGVYTGSLDSSPPINSMKLVCETDATIVWHQRLGHPSKTKFKQLLATGRLPSDTTITNASIDAISCTACPAGRMTRQSFPSRTRQQRVQLSATTPFGRKMVMDIAGPFPKSFPENYRYYLILADVGSKMLFKRDMKDKKHVPQAISEILAEMSALKDGVKFGILKMDEDSTFKSKTARAVFAMHGVHPKYAIVDQHQANGGAEVMIRITNDYTRLFLHAASLASGFWPFAHSHAVNVYNRMPNNLLKDKASPRMHIGLHDDILQRTITFGAPGVTQIPKRLRNGTFDAATEKCIYLGHTNNGNAMSLLMVHTGMIRSRRDFLFQPDTRHLNLDRIANMINGANHMLLPGQTIQDVYEAAGLADVDLATPPPLDAAGQKIQLPQPAPFSAPTGRSPTDTTFDKRQGHYVPTTVDLANVTRSIDRHPLIAKITRGNILPQSVQTPVIPVGKRTRSGVIESKATLVPGAFVAVPTITMSNATPDPKSLAAALKGPDATEWYAAATVEAKKLVQFHAFDSSAHAVRSTLDAGATIVPLVGNCTNKYDGEGIFIKRKFRLCAAGNREHHDGLRKASSPVVDSTAMAAVRAYAVMNNFEFYEADITNAYLNAVEEQPRVVRVSDAMLTILHDSGLPRTPGSTSNLLAVKRCLYGYDNSGRKFMELVADVLEAVGFVKCEYDPCTYKLGHGAAMILVCFHVDDFLFMHNNHNLFHNTCASLKTYFDFGHIRPAKHCLGITITKTPRGLSLGNQPLIAKAAHDLGITESNPKRTPWPSGAKVDKETPIPEEVDSYTFDYRSVLGIIAYVAQKTRPDVLVHTSRLASKQSNPNGNDYRLLKHLGKYMWTTRTLRLKLERPVDSEGSANSHSSSEGSLKIPKVVAYVDSDYAGYIVDRKSTSGFHCTLNNSIPIASSSNRQPTTATSSNEAELVALTSGAKRCVFITNILKFIDERTGPAEIYCDSQGAIAIANGIGRTSRSKHIDVKHYYIRELIRDRKIILHPIDTADNISDAMTKPLGKNKFLHFRSLLGIEEVDDVDRHWKEVMNENLDC